MNYEPNHLEIIIPPEWSGCLLESFLRNHLNLSRGGIRSLKRNNGLRLDGKPVFASQRLTSGAKLQLLIEPARQDFPPETIDLDIRYEDQDLIIINKPAGMAVHPVKKIQSGTLANALTAHWQKTSQLASFHPVHRLDRLTSGLVLIAKNPWSHQQLSLQFENRKLHRLYVAFVTGALFKNSGLINAPILESPAALKREIDPSGKPALTRYRVIRQFPGEALIGVKLYTGRTHQIRVHLAYLGHPLLGDFLYGREIPEFPRPALHAVRLRLLHPRSRKNLCISCPFPQDFLGRLQNHNNC